MAKQQILCVFFAQNCHALFPYRLNSGCFSHFRLITLVLAYFVGPGWRRATTAPAGVVGEGGSSNGGAATVSTPTAPRSSSAGVIDLSSPSWDDDPFLEAAEHPQNAAEPSGNRRSNKMTTTTSGGGGGGSTAARRRPAAPLTSISALFGGGAGGNRANRAG